MPLPLPPPRLPVDGEPAYMRIYAHWREEILAGRLPENAKLPSIRALAAHLGVSRNPVEAAYAQLAAEGYIVSRTRSGFFAANLGLPPAWPDESSAVGQIPTMVGESTAAPKGSPAAAGNFPSIPDRPDGTSSQSAARSAKAAASNAAPNEPSREPVAFDYDRTDTAHFPLALWRKLTHRALDPADRGWLQYGDPAGDGRLRDLIADYVRTHRGVVCRPDQIVVTAGTQLALQWLCTLIGDSGGLPLPVAVEEAMHPGIARTFRQMNARLRPVELEPDGLSVRALAALGPVKAVYTTPSHQFPYGMILSVAKRLELLQWAAGQGSYIIEDDYDSEFLYEGRPAPALQGLDMNGQVIYVGTFSKALAPAFRLGYMILPNSLLERFRLQAGAYDPTASALTQRTMALFMESGQFERHLRRMRKLYRRKRQCLLDAVRERLPPVRAAISGSASGLHALLRVDCGLPTEELLRRAAAGGVMLKPAGDYRPFPNHGSENAFRPEFLLGFGGLDEVEINEGVRRLAAAWR